MRICAYCGEEVRVSPCPCKPPANFVPIQAPLSETVAQSEARQTPRVDECLTLDAGGSTLLVRHRIIALARTLEHELDASVEAGARMIEDIDSYKREKAELRAELDDLKQRLLPQFYGRAERAEKENAELRERLATAERQFDEARKDAESKQAKIDALMLEFCPEDMSHAQVAEWCRSQRPMTKEESAALKESK